MVECFDNCSCLYFLPYAHILIYSLVKILICVHVYILKCEIFIEDEKKVEKIL